MIKLSNKCTKCGRIIKEGVASYSFHAFNEELCWDHQAQRRLELRAKYFAVSKPGLVDKKDEAGSESARAGA
jgi:hypothetical protein